MRKRTDIDALPKQNKRFQPTNLDNIEPTRIIGPIRGAILKTDHQPDPKPENPLAPLGRLHTSKFTQEI